MFLNIYKLQRWLCKGLRRKKIHYTFNTCPILLQWTLYQLQHVVKSVESQPVRTIQVLPFKDMYQCCKALQTLGSTVLLAGFLSSSLSTMVEGVAVLSIIVEVAVSVSTEEVEVGVLSLSLFVSSSSWPIRFEIIYKFFELPVCLLPNTSTARQNMNMKRDMYFILDFILKSYK